jgi:hypothetical protein
MAQALIRQPLIAESLFPSTAVHVKLVMNSAPLGKVPVLVRRLLTVSIIPHSINAPYSFNIEAI